MHEPGPMPDLQTGKPRPPTAPVLHHNQDTKRRPVDQARYHLAPESEGPVLEWDHKPKSHWLSAGLVISALTIGFLCLKNSGFAWMGTWWMWLFVIWPPPVLFLYSRQKGISAGAQWFAAGNRYVHTYDLTTIKVEGSSAGMSWALKLKDADGHETGIGLQDIQRNRRLWDLVYNGIRHSARQRPDAPNKRAVEILQLQ